MSRGHSIGTINNYNEIKTEDGKWKGLGKLGLEHPIVVELLSKGFTVQGIEKREEELEEMKVDQQIVTFEDGSKYRITREINGQVIVEGLHILE